VVVGEKLHDVVGVAALAVLHGTVSAVLTSAVARVPAAMSPTFERRMIPRPYLRVHKPFPDLIPRETQ
jgi:hypothetical protein